MTLNKPSGNMYQWAHTWNPLGGKCPHDCFYCYVPSLGESFPAMKAKYSGPIRLYEKELKQNLYQHGEGITIFVQSCGDFFAEAVETSMIYQVLNHCWTYPKNTYLLQTKNPLRFHQVFSVCNLPPNLICGTTIETNQDRFVYPKGRPMRRLSLAPSPWERKEAMRNLRDHTFAPAKLKTMVSLEPILKFDFYELALWIEQISPDFVSIGADSGGHNLPQPTWPEVKELITRLEESMEVRVKDNIKNLARKPGTKRRE